MSKPNPSLNLTDSKGVAAALRKPVSAIQRWSRMRVIPHISVGHRSKLYDLEAVKRALAKRTIHEVN